MPPSTRAFSETADIADAKAVMRKQAAKNRAQLAALDPTGADRLAKHLPHLIERFGNGAYAAYLPIRSELSPLPLVKGLAESGLVTAMPITPEPGMPLSFHQWAPGMPLDSGPYGTQQPPVANPLVTPTVILAPMLAFDDGCWRLGYGGGFYDRSLAALRGSGHVVTAIGIAYGDQRVAAVPTGPYDMALDAVLTPEGLIEPLC